MNWLLLSLWDMSVSGQSCLFTRQCRLLQAFSCPNLTFPRSVNTESEAASQSGPCVHLDSVCGVSGSQGRGGGRGRLGPAVLILDRATTDGCPKSSPPSPLHPTQGEGEQLSPEPMLMKVSAQHRSDISSEPEMTVTCVGGIPYS